MKTLIKKNLYYENTFSGEYEVDYKMHPSGSDQSKPSTGKHLGGRGLVFGGYIPTATYDNIEYFTTKLNNMKLCEACWYCADFDFKYGEHEDN